MVISEPIVWVPVPTGSVDYGHRRAEPWRPPVWCPVNNRRRTPLCEQNVPEQVTMDDL